MLPLSGANLEKLRCSRAQPAYRALPTDEAARYVCLASSRCRASCCRSIARIHIPNSTLPATRCEANPSPFGLPGR